MGDWQCVVAEPAGLHQCVADLREQVERLRAEREALGAEREGLRAEREALRAQREACRSEQLLREAARQERARTFERSLEEQAELLRELFQTREPPPAVSVFTTTPPAPGEFASRFPLISERLRNLSWRRPATLLHDRLAA